MSVAESADTVVEMAIVFGPNDQKIMKIIETKRAATNFEHDEGGFVEK